MKKDKEAERVVLSVARKYARRCWWADKDDLEQVAWEAVVRAKRTFDPRVGVPERAYLHRAATLSVRRYLWKESSPVSGGNDDPWTKKRQFRASIHEERSDESSPGGVVLLDPRPWPDALVEEKRWTLRVMGRLAESTRPEHDHGLQVLLDDSPAREVALEAGIPARDVYASTGEVRSVVSTDAELWMMMREIGE